MIAVTDEHEPAHSGTRDRLRTDPTAVADDGGRPRPVDGLAAVVRAVFDDLSPGRALDVATGTGRTARALADRGWTVDAIDLSGAQLERARRRTGSSASTAASGEAANTDTNRGPNADVNANADGTINWILADADSYCFPTSVYDLVTVQFFDARDRLPALIDALAPGGVLWYDHYLESAGDFGAGSGSGAGDRFRFEPNELLEACSTLTVLHYAEYRVDGEPRVTLLARASAGDGNETARWRPEVSTAADGSRRGGDPG